MAENRNRVGVVDSLLLLDREEDVSMKAWEGMYIAFCTVGLFLLVAVQEVRVQMAERRAKDAEQWAEAVAVEAQMWMEKR